VLVHCSDGWDRTSQLSALVQIFVDPYYRTIEGFEVLVEKEFIWSGHQFAHRLACGVENAFGFSDFCPVFLQFLDCVYQITEQFPTAFEFNESFLCEVAYHSFSAKFGTFLCNCERQRASVNLRTNTVSLWSYTNSQIEKFKNVLFSSTQDILIPDESVIKLKVWEGLYMHWTVKKSEGKKQLEELIRQKLEQQRKSELRWKEKEEELKRWKKRAEEEE